MSLYADIIVDITAKNLDKTFQYIVPVQMESEIKEGMQVDIPFGSSNKVINGYVISLKDTPDFDVSRLKNIIRINHEKTYVYSELIMLAAWMKDNYGSSMAAALKTVLPVKRHMEVKKDRYLFLNISEKEALDLLSQYENKHYTARARLLKYIISNSGTKEKTALKEASVTKSNVNDLLKREVIKESSKPDYRNPVKNQENSKYSIILSDEQKNIADDIINDEENKKAYLIHGITGSGKTEIYMEIIADGIKNGKQSILLIPEIGLTYQNVKRFYERFGNKVTVINSRLSAGEKSDQFLRAEKGEVDLVIGPRSALFTPFSNLGYIIIDEEHDGAYKSEITPRYHAVNTAIQRALMCNAKVVLGSATPSLESYNNALKGEYKLYKLNKRMNNGKLPTVHIVDMREEFNRGNRSIISEKLKALMKDRLNKHQQIMLFINRRGYESFVSCRSCGEVIKCPHCDVALSEHNGKKMVCHYCGYETKSITKCPTCGSKYIGGFKAGTQKIEKLVANDFPEAKIMRMDADTTKRKGSHERIVESFSKGEADILIGTQMIVKGHDFKNVTLVGILAADLSLYSPDFRGNERTFSLITQAVGRAGRSSDDGEAVIQTYSPDNYSIVNAASCNYEGFYDEEIAFRKLMDYPPFTHMLMIIINSRNEMDALLTGDLIKGTITSLIGKDALVLGPASPLVGKIKDVYKKVIYVRTIKYDTLKDIRKGIDDFLAKNRMPKDVGIVYDFDPLTY
ncbi:replication restart DNA helicase PriA [Acetitomaculum ruminis DSM 5522]|uniref:Replication restart protein PriA n=1 Tax=Acetitomaculum ruminis DSM 5522 TaxID=1120918 RepID=A0A1I0XUF4_9FIRM|nr:primosomal protein N' [Acetitomaculum ruminis]SFB04297.1 replication restart DNA helicase PriA [Acetitomaculum ruminis DSM 5522]